MSRIPFFTVHEHLKGGCRKRLPPPNICPFLAYRRLTGIQIPLSYDSLQVSPLEYHSIFMWNAISNAGFPGSHSLKILVLTVCSASLRLPDRLRRCNIGNDPCPSHLPHRRRILPRRILRWSAESFLLPASHPAGTARSSARRIPPRIRPGAPGGGPLHNGSGKLYSSFGDWKMDHIRYNDRFLCTALLCLETAVFR